MPVAHMDCVRGYDIYRRRTVIKTDRGDQTNDVFELEDPKTRTILIRSASLDEVRRAAKSRRQGYAAIGSILVELVHDRGSPRDVIVTMFNEDRSLEERGMIRLPWGASTNQVKEALETIELEASPSEVAIISELCRTPDEPLHEADEE